MLEPIRTLLSGLIDYAGLFPPARLDMEKSCEAYAHAKRSEHEWALGRFICPVSRLRAFSAAAAVMMPGTHATSGYREHALASDPWRVSVIVDGALHEDLGVIEAFNRRHMREDNGLAVVDALEMRVALASEIDHAAGLIPDDIYPFFEFPAEVVGGGDARGLIAALAGQGAAAKVRTGGITPEAFPSPRAVAGFIVACAAADVPFKATAGLHHPIRSEHPLTYEPGCPRGVMHGFLNVFLTAALVKMHRIDAPRAERALAETDPAAFVFTPEGVRWEGLVLDTMQLAMVRERVALSYGSCSFDEPIADLKALGLL
jgi:hypothetical protein